MKIRTCVFPIAGLGSRFLPATKSIPKEMLTVFDKPLIQYAVEEAQEAGIERFIFITSKGKSSIEDHFDANPPLEQLLEKRGDLETLKKVTSIQLKIGEAIYIRQSTPLGLGHALSCARHFVHEEAFAVILADDLILSKTPCLAQMMDAYKKGSHMLSIMQVPIEETSRYGIVDGNLNPEQSLLSRLSSLIEKPDPNDAPSSFAVVGRYILTKSLFSKIETQQEDAHGEIQLTHALSSLIEKVPTFGYHFQGTRYDCGTKEGWLKANIAFALQHKELGKHIREWFEAL